MSHETWIIHDIFAHGCGGVKVGWRILCGGKINALLFLVLCLTLLEIQNVVLFQAQELVSNENILLQTLGFDVAIDHPHTHVVRCCQLVKGDGSSPLGGVDSHASLFRAIHRKIYIYHLPTASSVYDGNLKLKQKVFSFI